MTRSRSSGSGTSALGLYRSGVHPALQLCLRRDGQVVLDRAIGHARGNGPATTRGRAEGRRHARHAVLRLLDLEGDHGDGRPHARRARRARHRRPGRRLHPRVRAPRQGRDHDRPRARPPRRRRLAAARRRSTSTCSPTASTWSSCICDAKPLAAPGKLLAYHAVSGGFILGEVVERVTGKRIREVLAEEILDPLGFRWGNYGVAPEDVDRVGLSYVTGPPLLPPVSTLVTRALGAPLDEVVELSNDPRFLTGDRPGGERRHHRQRALALLRDLPPRRRARRRAGDGARDASPRADRAVAARDRPLARSSRPGSATG